MKLQHRDSNNKLITYEQRGVKFNVSPSGEKWPVVEQYEDWKQKELMDSFHQSRFYKCPDEYRGVVYLKTTDGKIKRYYIDEQYDGLSITNFNNSESARFSVQTVVYDSEKKHIYLYYNVEKINKEQELTTGYSMRYDIDVSDMGKMTDKKILDTAINEFDNKFLQNNKINIMEII